MRLQPKQETRRKLKKREEEARGRVKLGQKCGRSFQGTAIFEVTVKDMITFAEHTVQGWICHVYWI